jgi:hypothetical protein
VDAIEISIYYLCYCYKAIVIKNVDHQVNKFFIPIHRYWPASHTKDQWFPGLKYHIERKSEFDSIDLLCICNLK